MKSLFELFVEALDDQAAEKKLTAVLKTQGVSQFVKKFKEIATDPKVQAILKAGITDGKPDDEKMQYSETELPVKKLRPTQNEIGFDESVKSILTDQYGSLGSIIEGTPKVGGPLVTYNSEFIIDGHHRWSQVYAANPKAKMSVINLTGNLKPTEVLKVIHAAIVIDAGEVPTVPAKGINILEGIQFSEVKERVNKYLSDKAKDIYTKIGLEDNQAVAEYIFNNLQELIKNNRPAPGAPERVYMPQTDQGGTKPKDKIDTIAKGIVNYKDPHSDDVKQ